MSFELVLFLGLAILAVLFAVGMLLSENAVHSALFLIGNFGCVAVLYLMLNAPFIGMVQIAVYAGAIMVLFLFVIMLLGAEQTTDTTRRFRWLSGAATILAMSFFLAIVTPLVIGGVSLPQPAIAAPQVRFVHTAGIPNNLPVNISVSGDGLPEILTIPDVSFGDVTPFYTLTAGTYSVLVQGVDGSAIMPPAQITLAEGQVASALLFEQLNLDEGQFPLLSVLPQSLAAGAEHNARFLMFNAYSENPLALVDLGPNAVVDTRARPQVDANGQPVLDETGAAVLVDGFDDRVVIPFTPQYTLSETTVYEDGVHNLALVDSNFEVIKTLFDLNVAESAEQLLVVGSDYQEFLGTESSFRPYILRNSALTLQTSAPMGSPARIGQMLFTDYLLPVNVVGILLLVALVGVVVLTRPETENSNRRVVRRRKVSRPLTSVISTQTGGEVTEETPKLPAPQSGD